MIVSIYRHIYPLHVTHSNLFPKSVYTVWTFLWFYWKFQFETFTQSFRSSIRSIMQRMLKIMFTDRNHLADRTVTIQKCIFHSMRKKFYVNSFKVSTVENEEVIPRSDRVFRSKWINIKRKTGFLWIFCIFLFLIFKCCYSKHKGKVKVISFSGDSVTFSLNIIRNWKFFFLAMRWTE